MKKTSKNRTVSILTNIFIVLGFIGIIIWLSLFIASQVDSCEETAYAKVPKMCEQSCKKLDNPVGCEVCKSMFSDGNEPKDSDWNVWKGKYASMGDGVRDGKGWCMHPSSRCYDGIRNRLKKRYSEYKDWFEKYSGGYLPAHIALTSCTEAPAGATQCSPDLKLRECGIMGLKLIDAQQCDINVADPEASIWCASYLQNKRMLAFYEKYPQVKNVKSPSQRYMLAVTGGGVGQIFFNIIEHSKAFNYERPFDRILEWMSRPEGKKPSKFNEDVSKNRVSAYKIGFRVGRTPAVMGIAREFYGVKSVDDLPFKEPVLIPRPEHLPKFPGVSLHGNFKKFKEMTERKP